MASTWHAMLLVAWHTLTIYVFLVVAFRLLGRRQLGQLNVIDLVIIVVMGSAVETAMVAGDTSLPAGIVSAGTLLLANRLLSLALLRSRRWRSVVSGDPILLVREGHFLDEHLRRAGLTQEDVLEAMREREECDVSHVKFAVLEPNGAITVIPRDAETHRVPYRDTPTQSADSTAAPG